MKLEESTLIVIERKVYSYWIEHVKLELVILLQNPICGSEN